MSAPDGTDENNPIIHHPGCSWETTPYCNCGADPARVDLAAENTRLRQQIADLETEANTLAASLRLAATLIRPNRESQP